MANLKVVTSPYGQQQSLSVAPPQVQPKISVAPPMQQPQIKQTAPINQPPLSVARALPQGQEITSVGTAKTQTPYDELKTSISSLDEIKKSQLSDILKRGVERGLNQQQLRTVALNYISENKPSQIAEVKEPGLGQSIVQGVVKPFLRGFSTLAGFGKGIIDAAQATTAAITGNEEAKQRNINEAMYAMDANRVSDFGYFGKIKPYAPANLGSSVKEQAKAGLDVLGGGLELGSYAIGGPSVAKNAGLPLLRGAVGQAARGAVVPGLGTGFTGGLGIGLQREDATVGSVLTDTALGTAIGGVLSPVLAGGGAGLSKGIREGTRRLMPKLLDAQKEFNRAVDTYYTRAFKPSTAGKNTAAKIERSEKNARLAVATILDNTAPENLPKTVDEALKVTVDTKKKIWNEIERRSTAAGNQGLKLDLNDIADEVAKIANDPRLKITSGSTIDYANDIATRLRSQGELTPQMAEDIVADLNSQTSAFWKNPNPKELNNMMVDVLITNRLRQKLIDIVESATGEGYAGLRKQYGALSEFEKVVAKQAARLANKNEVGFYDSLANMFGGADVISGVLSGSPTQIVRGLVTRQIAKGVNWFNSPDRITQKLFQESYKAFQRARDIIVPPKGAPVLPKNKMLPAPKEGGANVSINIPINVPPGGFQSTLGSSAEASAAKLRRVGGPGSRRTNQLPGIGPKIVKTPLSEASKDFRYYSKVDKGKEVLDQVKNKGKNQLYSVAGAGVGLEKDENGKIKFNPKKAVAGMALLAGGPTAMKKIKRIDKLTQQEMIDAIDYIRLKKPYSQVQEEYISKLVEKFNIPAKTLSGVANKLDELLSKVNKKKVDNPKLLDVPNIPGIKRASEKLVEFAGKLKNKSLSRDEFFDKSMKYLDIEKQLNSGDYIKKDGHVDWQLYEGERKKLSEARSFSNEVRNILRKKENITSNDIINAVNELNSKINEHVKVSDIAEKKIKEGKGILDIYRAGDVEPRKNEAGRWFTPSKFYAEKYTHHGDVKPYKLDLSKHKIYMADDIRKAWKDVFGYEYRENKSSFHKNALEHDWRQERVLARELKKRGYDGMYFKADDRDMGVSYLGIKAPALSFFDKKGLMSAHNLPTKAFAVAPLAVGAPIANKEKKK
jgi:hypothetical protein